MAKMQQRVDKYLREHPDPEYEHLAIEVILANDTIKKLRKELYELDMLYKDLVNCSVTQQEIIEVFQNKVSELEKVIGGDVKEGLEVPLSSIGLIVLSDEQFHIIVEAAKNATYTCSPAAKDRIDEALETLQKQQ
jgi:hypothetical protein